MLPHKVDVYTFSKTEDALRTTKKVYNMLKYGQMPCTMREGFGDRSKRYGDMRTTRESELIYPTNYILSVGDKILYKNMKWIINSPPTNRDGANIYNTAQLIFEGPVTMTQEQVIAAKEVSLGFDGIDGNLSDSDFDGIDGNFEN
jgi:hypothetical protein